MKKQKSASPANIGNLTRSYLIEVAKLEMRAWCSSVPKPLVLAILFCFITRAVEGKSFEEVFLGGESSAGDYEI